MREGSSLFRHYRSLRLPLSPKTQKSTENRCFFHALTEIRCRQNFPFFLTGETQHIDTPYLEVPVRFNMPIYAFLHNVLLVRKLNPHTKLQCSKTGGKNEGLASLFNIHTKLQCSKTWQWRQLKSLLFFVSEIATEMPYHHYARPSDRKRQHISFYRISSVFLCNDFRHKKSSSYAS